MRVRLDGRCFRPAGTAVCAWPRALVRSAPLLIGLCAACGSSGSDEAGAVTAGTGGGATAAMSMQPAATAAGTSASAGSGGAAPTALPMTMAGGGGTTSAGSSGTTPPTGGSPDSGSDAGTPPVDSGVDIAFDESTTVIPHPSWDCGLPAGIPGPSGGTALFEADLTVGEVHDLGLTQYGQRLFVEVDGGEVTGAKIDASVLDGGLEYQLTLANGAQEIEGVNILRTGDGTPIYFRSCATAPGEGAQTRIVADFEAPNAGAYAFLNEGTFVGTRTFDRAKGTLHLSLYEVQAGAPSGPSVRVVEPDGAVDQSWECAEASGTQGDVVYMESVGISGAGISVGASKRGTRNIIPITGGSFSGRLNGNVLAGGADYQLLGSAFELDARYTLHTDDDELIIVRNCGPVGALVPVFETRADGPYAWLNANQWLSSDPGVTIGAVNLTIYERR